MSRLPRVYTLLLRALPERFRAEHLEEMRSLLEEYTGGRSPWSRRAVLARAALDVLWVAFRLRLRSAVRRTREWSALRPPPGSPVGRDGKGKGGRRTGRAPLLEGVEGLGQDLRHTVRSLRRDAGLAVFATLIVGLGIGASSTVFSVAHALLIRPLPFDEPERLVWISNGAWGRGQRLSELSAQVVHVEDLRARARLLDGVVGYSLFDRPGDHTLTGVGEPERLTRLRVTGGFFDLLGVEPRFGRLFAAEELREGGPRAVLLLHGFWERRFAADPDVVGRTVTIDGAPATIMGVLPSSFDFTATFAPGRRVDYVAPFPLSPENDRRGNTLGLVGRLAPGATLEAAQAEASGIARRAPADGRNDFTPVLMPLHEHVSGSLRSAMLVLAAAVGLVMLIVCANLSNLLLARGTVRQKELAIRAALGAGRARLIRRTLTESLVLALAGGGLGFLLAAVGTRALARIDAGVPLLAHVRLDGNVLGFTLGIAVATGLLLGTGPALRGSARAVRDTLREGGRSGSAGRRRGRLRGALVVAEVALACLLLIGAGLSMRSLVRLLDVDLGFQPRNAVALRIDPPERFRAEAPRLAYYGQALRLVRAAPGVEWAGLGDVLPTAFNRRWCARSAEQAESGVRGCPASPYIRVVSEEYLSAMGLSLEGGRDFTTADDGDARPVAIVNEALAGALWPGRDPLGRALRPSGGGGVDREVVGVVRSTRYLTPEQEPGPELFLPIRQVADHREVHVIARGPVSRGALASALGDALRPLDPGLPLGDVVPIQDIVDRSVAPRRLTVLLLAGFAAFALVLASLGIYGVVSYSVRQRRGEIAVRVAIGASASEVRRRVLVDTLRLASAGLVLGLPAAWLLGRTMQGLLFGVSAADPVTFTVVPLVLMGVAGLAACLPAARAARLDPATVLATGR